MLHVSYAIVDKKESKRNKWEYKTFQLCIFIDSWSLNPITPYLWSLKSYDRSIWKQKLSVCLYRVWRRIFIRQKHDVFWPILRSGFISRMSHAGFLKTVKVL